MLISIKCTEAPTKVLYLRNQPQRIRVHFFGRQDGRPVSPLAGALGVGRMARPRGIQAQRFDRLAQMAPRLFEPVPADSTDLWVYAHDVTNPSELQTELGGLSSCGRRCVFFYGNDDAEPIPVTDENVALFRTSLYASVQLAHERAMPALCDDLLAQTNGELVERPWSKIPSVGFCGFVGSALKRFGYQVLGRGEKSEGLVLRERALDALERGSAVRTEFVRRSRFWGGSMGRFHFDAARQEHVRAEFVGNLLGTDYALCVRGKGNYSYRLYEALSAGRIPVFVNSDCVLPFEDKIDWKRHVVWVERWEIESAAERIASFHEELGPSGFRDLQRRNREIWAEWLSPAGFFWRALESLTGEENAS